MAWEIEWTIGFRKKFYKIIPKNIQKNFKNKLKHVAENPYKSKPLGYPFLREKKCDKWRVYFLIYTKQKVIYFIDLSNKKFQQESINKIKEGFKEFKGHIGSKYEEST